MATTRVQKEARKDSVQRFKGSMVLLTPWFWTYSLRPMREYISIVLSHGAWRLIQPVKGGRGSTVAQAEGEGQLLCRTHKSRAWRGSSVGSFPITQLKHVSCPREAVSWGEVALCRGSLQRQTLKELTTLSGEHPSLLEWRPGWPISMYIPQ